MSMLRRSRRRGMIMGAAIANSRNRKAAEQQAGVAQPQAPTADDSLEQIKKLAELRDQGILTDDEFEAKKKQLLGL